MQNTSSLSLRKTVLSGLQIKESVLVLAFSVLIPFVVHFIPVSGSRPGAVLLPIFIAPFLALLFFRPGVAIITALFSPVLNYLLTGSPVTGMLGSITVELVVFVIAASLLLKYSYTKYFAAVISVIAAMFASSLIFSNTGHFTAVVLTAIPGIALIAALNVIVLLSVKK